MRKKEVQSASRGRIVLMDSITLLTGDDAHAIVVSASHGGVSAGEVALEVPLNAVFFNDAGVGKDDAGIAALAILQNAGIAAGTVSHTSARIGDVDDTWRHGVISHVNQAALDLGFAPGTLLREALLQAPHAT
jgi:ABC-type molybdate transport system substrate-binding protein